MTKEFVPYAESLKLKQLGFDEPCFGRFYYPMLRPNSDEKELFYEFGQFVRQTEETTLSPTYSQCFRWFRQNGYRFNIVNDSENINGYYYYDVWYNGQFMFESHYIYPTYEEAELDCLRKLIQIVKNK